MSHNHATIFLKFFLFDIILAVGDKIFDGLTILNFFRNGDTYWACLTISILLIPGTLELIYWIVEWKTGECSFGRAILWATVFGPVAYPFSVIFWHLGVLLDSTCRGNFDRLKQVFSMSKVLKVLQACTESSFQIVLQGTILFISWENVDKHNYQIVSALTSSIFLAYSCSDHHFHEKSGKTYVPSLSQTFLATIFFWINIVSRAIVLSALAAYFHGWILIVLGIIALINAGVAYLSLRTDFNKDVWTSIGSIVTPACFVSKETIEKYKQSNRNNPAEYKFHRYYLLNTVIFTIVTIITTCLVHLFILDNTTSSNGLVQFNCKNLPIYSCVDPLQFGEDCYSRRKCEAGESIHDEAKFCLWLTVIIPNSLNFLLTLSHGCLCPTMIAGEEIVNAATY